MHRRIWAALAGAVLLVGISGQSATADAALIETTPADGGRLEAADEKRVTFSFNQKLNDLEGAASVAITGPSGDRVDRGDVTVAGRDVSRKFVAGRPGAYTASYRVVSSDGHPVTGTIVFDVAAAPSEPAVSSSAAPLPPATPQANDPMAREQHGGLPWLWICSGALAFLVLVGAARRRAGGALDDSEG